MSTIIHVVAFRHKTPGEGVGGFEWDIDRHEAWRRAAVATGVANDPNYETLVTTYETDRIFEAERDAITDEIDAWLWDGGGWDQGADGEAVSNLRMAVDRMARVSGATDPSDWRWQELQEAQTDVEQAIRFLTGAEVPS